MLPILFFGLAALIQESLGSSARRHAGGSKSTFASSRALIGEASRLVVVVHVQLTGSAFLAPVVPIVGSCPSCLSGGLLLLAF